MPTVAQADNIEIRGARENTLRDLDLDIPKRAITVVSGVSGSGKSSLVFDTLAAESQRQLNDLFSAFAQNRLPTYGQPDVDSLANLSAVAVIDQKRLSGGARSTVGTITDIGARLRLLFSRIGEPFVGYSNTFSFNDPLGMCAGCEGLGVKSTIDEAEFLDEDRTIEDGALLFADFADGWFQRHYAQSGFFDRSKPVREFTDRERYLLLHVPKGEAKPPNPDAPGAASYEGALVRFERIYLHKEVAKMKGKRRASFERIVRRTRCPDCGGTRLNDRARSCLIDGRSIADHNAMQVDELVGLIRGIDAAPSVAPLVADLSDQLGRLDHLGLGYLSLSRLTSSLSGGESQRVKMVRHLGSSLTDMLYVFDEPTVGLHPRDIDRLKTMLVALRDKGNTVVVVEHDREVIAIADHCIDMGPGAGKDGGEVTFEGPFSRLRESGTRTGEALRQPKSSLREPRSADGSVSISGARNNNLKDVSAEIPIGVLTAVTGVAGSGKSSLILDHLPREVPEIVVVDQSAIRGSRRSSPLTFTSLLDPIRRLFAKATGAPAAMFSPNSDGACPECEGAGVIYTDLAFMEGVTTQCEVCRGRRFRPKALEHELRGRSIADVFEMSVSEAQEFFTEKRIAQSLDRLADVGLPYLALGQTLTTLSGGERQRLKLATHLDGDPGTLVLDEPTTGLHEADVSRLVGLLDRIVDDGNTVVVIEHNLDLVVAADWVIDLGPEAGHDGGEIMFEGTPAELARTETHTGRALASYLEG